MSEHGASVTSESEEMYLITIARAIEDGHDGPVPVPHVAETLGVSQVAANEMIKKLEGRGFVEYTPYKGASLTDAGDAIAQGVLRRRRLWGVFLSEHLGMSPDDADSVACEFEHVTPADVERRLAAFLDDPKVGHQGRAIPETGSGVAARRLSDAEVGSSVAVVNIVAAPAVVSFLESEGLSAGAEVRLVGRASDGKALVAVAGRHVEVTEDLAAAVRVT